MSDKPAYIHIDRVDAILETMRKMISSKFGVTLQQDPNGTWGPMGKRYVTVRFTDPVSLDRIEVSMAIESVRSQNADREEAANND
jgi:hypothetical protein